MRQLEIEVSLTERELTRWLEAQQRNFSCIASSLGMRQQTETLARDLDNLPGHQHPISYSIVSEMLGSALIHNPDFQELFLVSIREARSFTRQIPSTRVNTEFQSFVQGRTAHLWRTAIFSHDETHHHHCFTGVRPKRMRRLGSGGPPNFEALDRIIQKPRALAGDRAIWWINFIGLLCSAFRDGAISSVQSLGIDLALAGNQGSGLYLNYDQLPVLGAYRWIASLNLALLTEMPQSKALAPANRLANTILIIGFLSAGILALAVQRLARQIVHPILAIEKTATQVASGDLSQKAPVTTEDEVGVLARTFNEMTEKLAASIRFGEQVVAQ